MNLNPFRPEWGAAKAVDGNINQDLSQNSCAIAGPSKNPVWWKVWLQNRFNIAYIEIYFRLDECADGYYDQNCSTQCGNCRVGFCEKKNGSCLSGCKLNWKEPLCQECVDGHYDQNCTTRCGNCREGFCDKTNGSCLAGCKLNWKEPLCQECSDGVYDHKCSTMCGNCSVGFCDKKNGSCLSGCKLNWQEPLCQECADGYYDESCSRQCGHCLQGDCDKTNGTCMSGCSPNWQEPFCQENETEVFDGVCNPVTNQSDDDGYYNTVQFNTNISIGDLQNVINEKSLGGNNQFHQEYKKLPTANLNICESAKKTENAVKNRFKTTFPYEHSRIILKERWNESDNDYINANFITDCIGENRYIAAQGPKGNTLKDFWRMIWQEDIKDIVMLANIIENGKNKCTQYWPEKDKAMQIGPCNISLIEETIYAFQTLRKFSLERAHPPSKRFITQFHYTAWPDHGTPEEVGLVQFHRFVSKRIHTNVPLLVHCSAGVGRTGTFIGLDSLLKQGRDTGRINVFEFVKQMRESRMTMVQTPEQYVFLHEALNCGFQRDYLLSKEEFSTKTEALLNDNAPLNQTALYKEFKFQQTLKPLYDHAIVEEARKTENTTKNYSKDILPVTKYRPYLTSYVKGRNDYINAVMVPSYINPSGLIITQKPLPDTEVDLWRLCFDHGVNALVILNEDDQANDWLQKRGLSKACVPYTVTVGDTGSNISGVSQDHLAISSDMEKKQIELFQVHADDNDAVLKAAELVLEKAKQSSFTSLVISKDGAGPAGVFCVLHNALQQISMDGEVDIFTIVRQLKIRRPEVITKLEEYRRCYQLVSQSVSTEGIYANM
ncbi:receptor-type tyrosine-protein phosphatase epsilon-like [Saccostrea echinata]|uniref:receptor-type tyrosine-protein phosphatase epsilon-like n=1 Tax=Saccostrea echinata TaxID=191078 RepID=UPI002A83E64F|nr:receptor-type tyrosine-protein phosphatase epsilon-like [Saccostrea echinata]